MSGAFILASYLIFVATLGVSGLALALVHLGVLAAAVPWGEE